MGPLWSRVRRQPASPGFEPCVAYLLGDEDDALVEAEGEGARVGKPLEQQRLQQLAVGTDEEDGALRTLQRRLALVRG